jgi:aminoglycoside 6'-N-acetyltransferase
VPRARRPRAPGAPLAAPPPAGVIEFEPLTEAHLEVVREWLGRDHVARWWRDPIEEELAGFRAAIAGRDPTDHYLIVLDGRPAGLIQTYRAVDYPDWDQVVAAGPDVAGVDLLIGEPELIGQGHGPRVLAEFARRIVFQAPGVHALIATVEEPNRRSWRAFEKAGFRHVRDVVEEGLPNRLMRLDRPPRSRPRPRVGGSSGRASAG